MSNSSTLDQKRRSLLLATALSPFTALAQTSSTAAAAAAARQPVLLPRPDAHKLRIAFGSCARQTKPQPIWAGISAAKPDLFLFLGDNFYADTHSEAVLRRRYAEFRSVRALQQFRQQTPHLAIWDDHDFGDDDAGGDYELKNLNQQLFCDEWAEPADSPRRTRQGIYADYRINVGGRSVQILMLDLRFNRTPLRADPAQQQGYAAMVKQAKDSGQPMTGWYVPNPDPQARLLGEEQWAWLTQRLAEPADLRLIGSSVQLAADGTGWEGWANFPLERERLVQLIKTQRANGVVFLSGDMHYGELSSWPVAEGYPLWDITSSGLTEVWDIPTPNRQRASVVVAETNFGLLDIDYAAPGGSLTLSILNGAGQLRLSKTLALDNLKFKPV
ncbi:alkaline phosphatase D family protein [Roseateles sp. GG27B]